jgi:hypothetical protein
LKHSIYKLFAFCLLPKPKPKPKANTKRAAQMWKTPLGVRKLMGVECTFFVTCVRDFVAQIELEGINFDLDDPVSYFVLSASSKSPFLALSCLNAMIVLRDVVAALLTDMAAPALTALHESAIYAVFANAAASANGHLGLDDDWGHETELSSSNISLWIAVLRQFAETPIPMSAKAAEQLRKSLSLQQVRDFVLDTMAARVLWPDNDWIVDPSPCSVYPADAVAARYFVDTHVDETHTWKSISECIELLLPTPCTCDVCKS